MTVTSDKLRIKIFADTADLSAMAKASQHPLVRGFTTNPSLMRKAGVADYRKFAKEALQIASDRPVSFEVFSDDRIDIGSQAHELASWGKNVYVKVPIVNSSGESLANTINALSAFGIKVNVTAIMDVKQCWKLKPVAPTILSVFAGRVADTGRDPLQVINDVRMAFWGYKDVEVLWASTREVYSVVQANRCACHIITLGPDLIAKLDLLGKDLESYSRETAAQFLADAKASGYRIAEPETREGTRIPRRNDVT